MPEELPPRVRERLRSSPVRGRLSEGRLLLDVRTLTDAEAAQVADAVRAARGR